MASQNCVPKRADLPPLKHTIKIRYPLPLMFTASELLWGQPPYKVGPLQHLPLGGNLRRGRVEENFFERSASLTNKTKTTNMNKKCLKNMVNVQV